MGYYHGYAVHACLVQRLVKASKCKLLTLSPPSPFPSFSANFSLIHKNVLWLWPCRQNLSEGGVSSSSIHTAARKNAAVLHTQRICIIEPFKKCMNILNENDSSTGHPS